MTKVDFRAAQLAICSTSSPPPRTESAACFECRLCGRRSAAAVVEMARRAKSFMIRLVKRELRVFDGNGDKNEPKIRARPELASSKTLAR